MAEAKSIPSEWTLELKSDNLPPEESAQTLVFTLSIDDRGVISGSVVRVDNNSPVNEPFSQVWGQRQPADSPDGSLLSLSFTSGDFNVFMSGFTFEDDFTRFVGRYRVTARNGIGPADHDPVPSAMVAAGPGDTGTGTGQQT